MPFSFFRERNKNRQKLASDEAANSQRRGNSKSFAPSSCFRPQSRRPSYLQQIGGEVALATFVEIFCERIVSEPYLMKFFRGVNVEQFKAHQLKFMRIALSHPEDEDASAAPVDVPRYRKYVVEKHSRFFDMGLNETHFDHVMVHFSETCHDLQVKERVIQEVYTQVLLPYRDIFVKSAW